MANVAAYSISLSHMAYNVIVCCIAPCTVFTNKINFETFSFTVPCEKAKNRLILIVHTPN